MKKITFIVAILLLLGSSNSAFANEQKFTDVSSDNQFNQLIYYLYEQNVINGNGPNTFAPKNNVTRGEAALMLARALKLDTTKRNTIFEDVSRQSVSSGAIQSAVDEGIIKGFTETKFGINEPIKRGDMAVLLARAFKLANEEVIPFEDVAISSSAYSSIRKVYGTGIVRGYSPVKFEVDKPVTREQFSAFLARALNSKLRLPINKCGYDPISRENPDIQTMNCLLTGAARYANIPPEIVKAIASREKSGWVHFSPSGSPIGGLESGIGLMQITKIVSKYSSDQEIRYDLTKNIDAGIDILQYSFKLDLAKIENHIPSDLESWYFAVLNYHNIGLSGVNIPIDPVTGLRNSNAYQEKVYKVLENDGRIKTNISSLDMKSEDFRTHSTYNLLSIIKKHFTLSGKPPTPSTELLKDGENVKYSGKMRTLPTTQSDEIPVTTNEVFTILAGPVFDRNVNSNNRFIWYPVQTTLNGKKVYGFIESSYIIQ